MAEVTDDGSPAASGCSCCGTRRHDRRRVEPATPTPLDGRGAAAIAARADAGPRTVGQPETAALVAELIRRGHRTIAFCRSRKGTELIAADVRRRLPAELADQVRPYRGGYLTAERREIEGELFGGRLRGVVATTALELGIDIGGLDACVLNGFPGTIASMWQQAGRAGREAQQSIAVLVAGDDQLDQWFMAHPDQVFTRPPEPAVINPANPYVLHAHLACAAYEQPLGHADERWWPGTARRRRARPGARRPAARSATAAAGSVRGPAGRVGRAGLADPRRRPAQRLERRGAHRHRGRHARRHRRPGPGLSASCTPARSTCTRASRYRVRELDLDDGAAIVEPADGGEYTQPRTETDITILGADADAGRRPQRASPSARCGCVSRVIGYQRFDALHRRAARPPRSSTCPPGELTTRAFWYTSTGRPAGRRRHRRGRTCPARSTPSSTPPSACCRCSPSATAGTSAGVSTPLQAETGLPTIVIYDGYPGGAGIAELGFASADRHLRGHARGDRRRARAADGCPSCVQSPKCGNGNEPLDKAGAIAVLTALGESQLEGAVAPARTPRHA